MTFDQTPPPEDRPIGKEPSYQTKSVRTIRGMDVRTRAKWEKDGWEFVAQNQIGLLRNELTFRRPKKKQPWYLWPAIGAFVLLIVAGFIVAGALKGGEDSASSHETSADAASTPSSTPTPEQTTTVAPPTAVPTPPHALSEINAAQFLAMAWEAKFTYGGTVHWIGDRITTANADGSYTFKITATVKNQYGTDMDATIEGDVAGTDAAPTITDSILYTDDGQIVSYNG